MSAVSHTPNSHYNKEPLSPCGVRSVSHIPGLISSPHFSDLRVNTESILVFAGLTIEEVQGKKSGELGLFAGERERQISTWRGLKGEVRVEIGCVGARKRTYILSIP